ncbi:MAG: hypothetical protein BMS9Abin24_013 [Thermodesulfobacteriota bacterium]|nr:MAG: hypothetical protein BMS9Abin24_013 [Thermodesulfobacteriota bacterium]
MNVIKNNRGAITIKGLFWTLVIASSLYAAYKFIPPAVTYYMIRTEVEDEARIAHMHGDAVLAARILEKANIWSVPIDREDIEIERDRDSIAISVNYSTTISFFNRWSRVQNYSINVEEPLKGR